MTNIPRLKALVATYTGGRVHHSAPAVVATENKRAAATAPPAVVEVARRVSARLRQRHETVSSLIRQFDRDHDGRLSLDELRRGFERHAAVVLNDADARAYA